MTAATRWLAPEGRRFGLSTLVAVVVVVPVSLLLPRALDRGDARDLVTGSAIGGMAVLDVACLVYVLLTIRAFTGVPAAELPALVAPRPTSTVLRFLRGGSDGPAVAIQYAVVALVAAALLPRAEELVPEGGARTTLVVLAVAGVVLCWAVLNTSYAVHYVRTDSRHNGLRFPGDEPPTFGDYVYFAVSVGTTLGTTDVQVDGRRMRRVVTGHALLSFVFNTVILALVLSALTA